jgi:uracil-DNA glycosylase family 4
LRNAYITAAARCAPPANKPLPDEISNCRAYLEAEIDILQPRAVLALGKIAFDAYLKLLRQRNAFPRGARFEFHHGASFALPGKLPQLFTAYHPSQQNTQTGRVTPAMYQQVLRKIRRFLEVGT